MSLQARPSQARPWSGSPYPPAGSPYPPAEHRRLVRVSGLALVLFALGTLALLAGTLATDAAASSSGSRGGVFAGTVDLVSASAGPSTAPGPSASPAIIGIGDPRSNGAGPGLVGAPVTIAIGVVLLGAIAAAGTYAYMRWVRSD